MKRETLLKSQIATTLGATEFNQQVNMAINRNTFFGHLRPPSIGGMLGIERGAPSSLMCEPVCVRGLELRRLG